MGVFAAAEESQSHNDTKNDAARVAYPVVVECESEKESDAEHDCDDADDGEPVSSKQELPFGADRPADAVATV